MKTIVREHFAKELCQARTAIKTEDFKTAWMALQRVHILGQQYPFPHAIAHWEMLKLAWRQGDFKEVAGQLISTILAIPLTILWGRKRALRGGTNSDRTEQMSIPEELRQILKQ